MSEQSGDLAAMIGGVVDEMGKEAAEDLPKFLTTQVPIDEFLSQILISQRFEEGPALRLDVAKRALKRH